MEKIIDINISNFSRNISNYFNIDYNELIKLYKSNKKYIIKNKPKIQYKNIELSIYKDDTNIKYLILKPISNNKFYAFKLIQKEI